MNFYFNLKNKNGGYQDAIYWVAWLIQWEKINKKKKVKFEIECRDIDSVDPKYCKDPIWLLWEMIFYECTERDNNTKIQIQSLYRFSDIFILVVKEMLDYHYYIMTIGYLSLPVKFNIPIRKRSKYIYTNTM